MTSLQQSAPGSKSAKFINANPLEPMLVMGGDRNLARNVNERLKQQKQQQQPTVVQQQQPMLQQQPPVMPATKPHFPLVDIKKENDDNENQSSDDNDSFDFDDDEDDDILARLRAKRLAELQQQASRQRYGEYRIIAQDAFLEECRVVLSENGKEQLQDDEEEEEEEDYDWACSSEKDKATDKSSDLNEHVVVHFFHREFQRCDIMTQHLQRVAQRHRDCKFIGVDAEKTPFFVQKLRVRTLPTVIVFLKGRVVARLTGFEGLTNHENDSGATDEWETPRLEEWLARTGAISTKGRLL